MQIVSNYLLFKCVSWQSVGSEYGLSKNTVARLLRINKLSDSLKKLVDLKILSVRAGVKLSYISDEAEKIVFDYMYFEEDKNTVENKLSEANAKIIRGAYEDSIFHNEDFTIATILCCFNKRRKTKIKGSCCY